MKRFLSIFFKAYPNKCLCPLTLTLSYTDVVLSDAFRKYPNLTESGSVWYYRVLSCRGIHFSSGESEMLFKNANKSLMSKTAERDSHGTAGNQASWSLWGKSGDI